LRKLFAADPARVVVPDHLRHGSPVALRDAVSCTPGQPHDVGELPGAIPDADQPCQTFALCP
jgi:hypothetical protein